MPTHAPTAASQHADPDDLLTPTEVAALTRLAPRTLADMRWRGGGPPFTKLGPSPKAHVRYRRGDVLDWMQHRDG